MRENQSMTSSLPHISPPDFPSTVKACFFGREGGVSEGIYGSLNCALGSDDPRPNVLENRARIITQLGGKGIAGLYQIHSATCHVVDQPLGEVRPEGDALVTMSAGVVLSVLTADCGPVLFSGKMAEGRPVIGAAHSGWKGAVGGVLESTIQAMTDLGARDIQAALGPMIAQSSYEVSKGFEVPLLEEDETAERFFMSGQNSEKLLFDLPGYIAFRLGRAGLKNVWISGRDTYGDEKSYFSYRRTTHRQEPDYGRQLSTIMIVED